MGILAMCIVGVTVLAMCVSTAIINAREIQKESDDIVH